MKLLSIITGLTILAALTQAKTLRSKKEFYFELRSQYATGYVLQVISENGDEWNLGVVGLGLKESEGASLDWSWTYHEDSEAYQLSLHWEAPANSSLVDCINFGDKQWFGGPEQKQQWWPVQKSKLQKYSYISKEDDNAAVSERYWVNSEGEYLYVDARVPLFVDYHNYLNNHLCLIAEVEAPYSKKRTHNILKYDVWFLENAKVAHQHAVDTYLGKPSGIPDFRMIQHPVWSTWARYSREIDENILRTFANEIIDNGFNNAQFEIDDLWETCYGSLTVDDRKFSDFGKLVQEIKSLGFRVTIWIHPFINKGCDPWYTEALNNGYLVLNEDGSPDTIWWNKNGTDASYIDFTNPEAASWWASRLRALIETYDIDSIKFDAGESSWSPQVPVQNGDIDLHPGHIVEQYVRLCAEFGSLIEIRSGMRTQDLPVFVRMVDKDTLWDFENGLATLVTTLLQMNMNGYGLVLPDMIGGNGYNAFPSKELFIRWLQANTFMPTLQYSFVPWDFDAETIEISRKYTNLHAEYAEHIKAAMEASVQRGSPVNAPIWWLDPTDKDALAVDDEYLLGEDILVAPVVVEDTVARDVYLPRGLWREGLSGEVLEGGRWYLDYAAPLDTLLYFIKED